jgi:small-conductance mechanosensitive channel
VPLLLLISATVILVRLINGLLKVLTAKTPSASVSLLNNLVTGVGALVIGALVLGFLFDTSFVIVLFIIVGGITGLTVVFQRPLNDLVSGVSLTLSNRLAPGHWIRLPSGIEGQVTDIQWDVTIIKQLVNNVIVVPNSTMTEAEIINFDHMEPELAVAVAVGVSYDSNLVRVEQVTLEEANNVMRQINGSVSTAEPLIRYNAFADSSINFNVFLRATKYADQFLLKHEFIKRLHQRYGEEGIIIPFPIRTLNIPSERQSALKDQSRPEATEA